MTLKSVSYVQFHVYAYMCIPKPKTFKLQAVLNGPSHPLCQLGHEKRLAIYYGPEYSCVIHLILCKGEKQRPHCEYCNYRATEFDDARLVLLPIGGKIVMLFFRSGLKIRVGID